MRRFYIKATASACYDKSGLTFPKTIQYCLETAVKAQGAKQVRWALQHGWSNQPKVLCFNATIEQAAHIHVKLAKEVGNYFVVIPKSW
jgi:hypothetical protein